MQLMVLWAAAVACTMPMAADAAVVIDIGQNGPDVVATLSGSLSGVGLFGAGNAPASSAIASSFGYIGFGGTKNQIYHGFNGPANWGSGGIFFPSSTTGNAFAFEASDSNGPFIIVSSSFGFGSALSASSTFSNQTLTSLGLNTGSYVYTSSGDSITVNVGNTGGVPEPANWALMVIGFALTSVALRGRVRATRSTVG